MGILKLQEQEAESSTLEMVEGAQTCIILTRPYLLNCDNRSVGCDVKQMQQGITGN